MKTFKLLPVLLIVLLSGCQQAINYADNSEVNKNSDIRATSFYTSTGAKKFPYTTTSFNIVKPNSKTQAQLNNDVLDFYNHWKMKYVRGAIDTFDGDKPGYIVLADGTGDAPDSWKKAGVKPKSHSEANGYGMIISALMGDKDVFDGLYIMYNNYRSAGNPELMSWIIPENESKTLEKTYSATDGDVDMAYALLLADNQWGSDGYFNYKNQALKMITAIKTSLFNHSTMRTTRGDWDSGDGDSDYSTRASDWLVAEFQTFFDYTNDTFWTDAIDEIYKMIDEVIAAESPNTHLMPDFVEGIPARKASPEFLEAESDDDYAWNACRYPWRIGMGYGQHGDIRSKNALDGFVDWAIAKCGGSVWDYRAGYELNGTPMEKIDWKKYLDEDEKILNPNYTKHITGQRVDFSSNAYYSPLTLAATHDSKNQSFINSAWNIMIRKDSWNSFFGDTITMQCLLYISGNWWVPGSGGNAEDTEAPTAPTNLKGTYDSSTKKIKLSWNHGTDNVGIEYYVVEVPNSQISLAPVTANTSGTVQTHYISLSSIPGNSNGYYEFRVKSMDAAYNQSPLTNIVRVDISNSTTDIPSDPAATSKPNSFDLSQNKWGGENTYKITADMWYGQNATVVKLYENGNLIKTVKPAFDTPSAQKVVFSFTGKAKGTYVYKVDAINQHGTTTSSNFTYTVTQ